MKIREIFNFSHEENEVYYLRSGDEGPGSSGPNHPTSIGYTVCYNMIFTFITAVIDESNNRFDNDKF